MRLNNDETENEKPHCQSSLKNSQEVVHVDEDEPEDAFETEFILNMNFGGNDAVNGALKDTLY